MLDHRKLLGLGLASILLLTEGAAEAQQPAPGSAAEATKHLQAGMSASSAGRWDAALTEYSASNAAAPSVVALEGLANAHYQLGMCFVNLGKMPEAVTEFEAYLQIAPDGQYASQAKALVAQLKK